MSDPLEELTAASPDYLDEERALMPYPEETSKYEDDDDGTMPDNVDQLRQAVVGRKIVHAHQAERSQYPGSSWKKPALILTLDGGTEVELVDTDDCCAYTELEEFFLHPESVDHVILGVGTTDFYDTWHIYADFGDVMKLKVGWSPGNPFYYGYGFNINVKPATIQGEVIE